MSNPELEVTAKEVDDILIAAISFRGQYGEIPKYFDKLHRQVKPHISGSALCLFHGGVPEGHHLEVCYPVSKTVDTEVVTSRILQGGEMLAARHSGPCDSSSAVWQDFSTYLRQHNIELAEDPPRLVYLEDGDERRDSAEECTAELQVALLLPKWLRRLAEGLDRFAGEATREQVMEGSGGLTVDSTPHEKAEWVKGAMERLDAAIADEETRGKVLAGCSHRFPDWRIEQMRTEYERLENIDELLVLMRLDKSVGGLSWYEHPERVGNTLHVTKDPYNAERYLQATDLAEKRSWYCHCGLVRAAIGAGETISQSHCYCGAGWYQQLWEGVLGKPVKVELVRSVLQGDDCCSFAIHLPLEGEPK
jgi:effector-binding domain-containing protein